MEAGATLAYGSKEDIYRKRTPNEGNFISPMIFTGVPKNSPGFRGNTVCRLIFLEEIFGPAFMVFKYKTETEAIEMANDTVYGLG